MSTISVFVLLSQGAVKLEAEEDDKSSGYTFKYTAYLSLF